MESHVEKTLAHDGTIDHEYTWERPPATYMTPVQHLRLLAMKGRLEASGELYMLRQRLTVGHARRHESDGSLAARRPEGDA